MQAATASQTVGPYWHLIEDKTWADATRFGATGEKITFTGTLTDGEGALIPDGCVEIWQSDPPASETFPAFARARTGIDGSFRIVTLKPGPVPGRGNTQQAPHIAVSILARGLVKALFTRAYFEGDPLNANDPLLSSIEDETRRATLIAHPRGAGIWHLDIRLQGGNETVFLDI